MQTSVDVNASSSSFYNIYHCLENTPGVSIVLSFLVTRFLFILPLSIFILHLGIQRWRQQGSSAATSHSDVFTYHSAVMELVYALGMMLYFGGQHAGLLGVMTAGYYVGACVLPAHTSLHIFTCVERYLAVVHPVLYLRLRRSGRRRVWALSTGYVWLLCGTWIGLAAGSQPNVPYVPYFCILILFLVVVSFCSVSVLCALLRPGPGDAGGSRERVDQSKRRAFHVVTAITAVLWTYFLGFLVCTVVGNTHGGSTGCLVLMFGHWFALPTTLVLPLLFLQRAGKLRCCHGNNE